MLKASHLNKGLAFLVVGVLLQTACQKKRSPEFVQGEGEYVYRISDFSDAQFKIETGKFRAPAVASEADEVVLAEGNDVIRSFDSVGFSSDIGVTKFSDKVLNDLNFYGRGDSSDTYSVQLGFTENHLVVYKLAKKSDIPSDEMTYAVSSKVENVYKVPMFGYPLNKYTVEPVKDLRGKDTKQKTTVSKKFLAQATHFSIDTSKPLYFKAEAKKDLLPASFFDEKAEWFYEVSVVDGPLNVQLGEQLQAGKARFARTSNSLMAVDVNIPEEAQSLSPEKLPKIFQMPVRWVDFKLVQSGENALLEEKLLDEKDSGAVDWTKRTFGLFDLRRINNLDSANVNSVRIKRLEVDGDYFSVILSNSNNGLAFHYSFHKRANNIAGRTYPVLDRKKYGFWEANKSFYLGQLTTSEKNFEQNTFLSRMYPDQDGVIRVYLTDNTPDIPEFVESIRAALESWDKAFADAARGTDKANNPYRVIFDTSKKVKNGDVRYNKISFYDFNINVGGLLGYGPSVTDGRNGEIHASTNHIYLRTYREGVYADLKDYIRYKLGLYDNKRVPGITFPGLVLRDASNLDLSFDGIDAVSDGMFLAEVSNTRENRQKISSELLGQVIKPLEAVTADRKVAIANKGRNLSSNQNARKNFQKFYNDRYSTGSAIQFAKHDNCGYRASVFNTFKQIESVCGQLKFGAYVETLANQSKSPNWLEQLNFDSEIFNECAMKLLAPTLRSTLVHEFGHNLGLTHNFMGSADDANFRRDAKGIPIRRTTSVMDYPDADEDRGFEPGTYDVAAIRYGYYNAVELKENDASGLPKIISVANQNQNDTRPIEDRVPDPSKLKNYLYCWDLDIFQLEIPMQDARCRRWDRGSNPVQMAKALIDRFDGTSTMRLSRFEAQNLPDPSAFIQTRVMIPLKSIYDQYRYLLYLKTRNLNDPYFVKNESVYRQYLATYTGTTKVEDLPKDVFEEEKFVESLPELEQYRLAADIIFKFFKELAFAEDKYCTLWKDSEFVNAVPFARLRALTFNKTRTTINSCAELASAMPEYSSYTIKEYGTPFNQVNYNANDEEFETKAAVYGGIKELRSYALTSLTQRAIVSFSGFDIPGVVVAVNSNFLPSFMDDPDYRRELLDTFEKRIVNGVQVARFVPTDKQAAFADQYINQFSEERELLFGMYAQILSAMFAPGENSAARLKALQADVYNRADFERIFADKSKIAYVASASGQYFVAENPDSPIFRLIQQFSAVSSVMGNSASYDLYLREKETATNVAIRVKNAFLDKYSSAPVVDANFLKLLAAEEAIAALVPKYVAGAPAPARPVAQSKSPAEPKLVQELTTQAALYLDLAKVRKVPVDADLVRSIVIDLAGAQVQEKDLFQILFGVLKSGESDYINLAYRLIVTSLNSGDTLDSVDPAKDLVNVEAAYTKLLEQLKANKLTGEEFSERGAQESILRNITLTDWSRVL